MHRRLSAAVVTAVASAGLVTGIAVPAAATTCDAYSHTCPTPPPTVPPTTPPSVLPFTGASTDVSALVLASLGAVGGGAVLIAVGRRRGRAVPRS